MQITSRKTFLDCGQFLLAMQGLYGYTKSMDTKVYDYYQDYTLRSL